MKNCLCFLMLAGWFTSQAQEYKLNQRYPGYFINAKGDTIRGYILLTNKLDNQLGAEYSNDAKGEKIRIFLLPGEVRGFKVQNRNYTAVEHGDVDLRKHQFLLVRQQGEITLCEYFRLAKDLYIGQGNGQRPATGDDEQYLQSEYVVISKSGKKFVITNSSELSKQAAEIFTDDDSLTRKIQNKEKGYRYADLPELVKTYNAAQDR
jgi:hypothetical protein